jgi:hypothetical protein
LRYVRIPIFVGSLKTFLLYILPKACSETAEINVTKKCENIEHIRRLNLTSHLITVHRIVEMRVKIPLDSFSTHSTNYEGEGEG